MQRSPTLTHTYTPNFSLSHTLIHSHTDTHSLSLSHTHTLSHTHYTHSHALLRREATGAIQYIYTDFQSGSAGAEAGREIAERPNQGPCDHGAQRSHGFALRSHKTDFRKVDLMIMFHNAPIDSTPESASACVDLNQPESGSAGAEAGPRNRRARRRGYLLIPLH
jgi:hypothetical protein